MRLISLVTFFATFASTISWPTPPKKYGVLLIPGFDPLDVFGPLEYISRLPDASVYLIAESSMDPVYSFTLNATMSTLTNKFGQLVLPTHTIATAPALDVLVVVGGVGARGILAGLLQPSVGFIRETYPSLKYLLSICTGIALTAASGILDGRNATGNKRSWAFVTGQGPNVHWVPKARWVVDGNIWSSSGVEAGTDMIYSFIKHVYTAPVAQGIANLLEHIPQLDPAIDFYADVYNTSGTLIPPAAAPSIPASAQLRFGVLVYPGFASLEAWGALEYINLNALTKNISIIAAELNPVTENVYPSLASWLPLLPKRGQKLIPKFTLEDAPELDVLLVPGAPRIPKDSQLADFIATKYPSLKYLISVGTGSALVAQSGVSKDHESTTAKPFFNAVKLIYQGVDWKAKARWTVSDNGKLWSSSGGASILDTMHAFTAAVGGVAAATYMDTNIEYLPTTLDPAGDPFAGIWGAN